MTIILTTLNARYSHCALGLRYLYANMQELQSSTKILEFVINDPLQTIAEKLLENSPDIIGIGVYIWNASEVAQLIEILKKVSPQTHIVLGGPEASHTPFRTNLALADYIIQGEGDLAFAQLCRDIRDATPPASKIIKATPPDVKSLILPYESYSDHDIAHRTIYVEASRGCPFECEFCLSAIDEKVRNFDLDLLLEEFEKLWDRGVRSFKFIDRTFNLNMKFAHRILDFFLAKEPPYFAHFEVIPDHFPDSLKERIAQFPPAALQLEIGIQTLNKEVAKTIRRILNIEKIITNITFLETHTHAHMHLDLIVGLPGESLESFGENLNTLCRLTHSEIQIGILKKLSGTTLSRHDHEYGMVYSDTPPYDILKNNLLSFHDIQRMKRFARFWDMFYNSGNFVKTLPLLWSDGDVYTHFGALCLWIYEQTQATWQISLDRLAQLLFEYLTIHKGYEAVMIANTLAHDVMCVPGRRLPSFLRDIATNIPDFVPKNIDPLAKRQARHAQQGES